MFPNEILFLTSEEFILYSGLGSEALKFVDASDEFISIPTNFAPFLVGRFNQKNKRRWKPRTPSWQACSSVEDRRSGMSGTVAAVRQAVPVPGKAVARNVIAITRYGTTIAKLWTETYQFLDLKHVTSHFRSHQYPVPGTGLTTGVIVMSR